MNVTKEMVSTLLGSELSKPYPEAVISCKVEISPSDMLEDLSEALILEIDRLLKMRGSFEREPLTKDMLTKYLTTLVWLRVCWCNGSMRVEYRQIRKTLQVPSLMYVLLLQIGEAIDPEHGIRFKPHMEIDSDALLSASEMRFISDKLFLLESLGLKVEAGIPPDQTGELGFMALTHIEGVVTSYRMDHPVNGFLAGMLRMKKLEEVIGMERIRYGYMESYRQYLKELVVGRSLS